MHTRLGFYARAICAHLCILVPFLSYSKLKEWSVLGFPFSLLFYAAGALVFGAILFFIFFNVDHLFLSYSMHRYRNGLFDPNGGLRKATFIIWRSLIWVFTLSFPLVFVAQAPRVPGAVTLYIGLFALGFFLINMGFLFTPYNSYRQKLIAGMWGIGALRSPMQ